MVAVGEQEILFVRRRALAGRRRRRSSRLRVIVGVQAKVVVLEAHEFVDDRTERDAITGCEGPTGTHELVSRETDACD